MSFSVKSIVLSVLLHLAVIALPGSTQLDTSTDSPTAQHPQEAGPSRLERDEAGPKSVFPFGSAQPLAGSEQPVAWSSPVFAPGELGPAIPREPGRAIKTYTRRAPSLHPPEFTPYVPPTMAELAIDPDQDVLLRGQRADYGRNDLEDEKHLFRLALADDLQDCRLDRVPLAEALLRLSYFRLQDELLRQGKKPDFSYAQVRERLNDKMAAIRREVAAGAPENWATALLLAYRRDKIYEERRGHSLLNSIWYDLYNCRTGSEELLLYLSRYHPELELGTMRGSVLKHDGTLMGHMDPAVKISGRWLVLKTVATDTVLVEEYRIGELYPLEKIVLDYLPELADDRCRLASPLARNGEPLTGTVDPYAKGDHPLAVKDKPPSIILWREKTPYSGPFRMMGREDRLLHEMLAHYNSLADERQLLSEDDPFADLLFHLLLTEPGERHALLDLYLRKRVTSYPAGFKRPLRTAEAVPGYGDLLATLPQGPGGTLELAPGNLVPLSRFSGHARYLALTGGRMAELTRQPSPRGKLQLTEEIKDFLFTTPGQGVTAIFPPFADSRALAAGLLDDAYDLALDEEEERTRRANQTSARAIAIVKAGLLDHPRQAQELLEQRISLLREVLAHRAVATTGSNARPHHEPPAGLTFAETIAQGGRQGLSPGFIKDMVELMGEEEAVQGFRDYLQPAFAAAPDTGRMVSLNRQRTAEMLGYFDRYLLLEKSKQQLIQAAHRLHEHHPDPAARVGAAQFLVSQGGLDPARAGKEYADYLLQQPFDVRELRSLLETGLDRQKAGELLHRRIDTVSLRGLEKWDPGRDDDGRVPVELLQLDELMRAANMLGDKAARQQIADKLTELLQAVFATGRDPAHYANGLNGLSALSRSGTTADEPLFPRFVAFGSRDPAGFLYAKPLRNWLGPDRYRSLVVAARREEQSHFAAALDSLGRLRAQGETSRGREELSEWPAAYGATLQSLASRAAAITFLNGLIALEGQIQEADRSQSALLAELFKQVEFQSSFATTYGEKITAVRDRALLDEPLFRAVELAGHFAQKSGQPGRLELNHAPTVRLEGEFRSACGSMAKIVDSRNAPRNPLFTKAAVYFDSLLDPENSPALAAEAYRHERGLRELLSRQPLTAATGKELDETEVFFRDLGKSGSCDIRRLYLLEKLLRRAVLPERLPDWILSLARDSYSHEMAYLERIRRAGGVEAIFQEYRKSGREEFRRKWGDSPFSIRNLYGTMVLLKTGHLRLNSSGEFVVVR